MGTPEGPGRGEASSEEVSSERVPSGGNNWVDSGWVDSGWASVWGQRPGGGCRIIKCGFISFLIKDLADVLGGGMCAGGPAYPG